MMKRLYPLLALIFTCNGMDQLSAPGPVFGFGQNILEQGSSVIGVRFDNIDEDNSSFTAGDIGYIYGITNSLSLELELYYIFKDKRPNRDRTKGLGTTKLQLEYAFYEHKEFENFFYQATIVGSIYFPSATTDFQSIIANKSSQFFIGVNNSLLANNWYYYSALGGLITTRRKNEELPNRFFYDWGIGKKFKVTDTYYLAAIFEFEGIYSGSSTEIDLVFPKSNLILLGPSLRWATDEFVVQFGFQYPITQNNIPRDEHFNYRGALVMAWRFS